MKGKVIFTTKNLENIILNNVPEGCDPSDRLIIRNVITNELKLIPHNKLHLLQENSEFEYISQSNPEDFDPYFKKHKKDYKQAVDLIDKCIKAGRNDLYKYLKEMREIFKEFL